MTVSSLTNYSVSLKAVDKQLVASIRDTISNYAAVDELLAEIEAYLATLGLTGTPGAIWHEEEYKESDIDAEAVVFLTAPVEPSGRIKVYDLPPFQMATTIHTGTYESMTAAYDAAFEWIAKNEYTIVGPNREIYRDRDGTHITELQFPVENIVNPTATVPGETGRT